jgi:sugar lactone lactonase YvrE
MKHSKLILLLTLVALSRSLVDAQNYDTNNVVVQGFAGFGIPGYVDGQGLLTQFASPAQVVSDTASNLYVWDSGNARIRKITPNATVTTFAGGGTYLNAYGTNASLAWGTGGAMAIDHANTLWLVLANGYGGVPYLVTISTNGYVAIENGGLANLTTYSGICFDSANNLYYSGGNRIYRYTPNSGSVQAIAGAGTAGNFDGNGPVFSQFNNPTALACDQADNLYVWDSGNGTIRRIDQALNVVTLAGKGNTYYSSIDGVGTNAAFSGISSMCLDNAGNLYLVCGNCVRKMDVQTNVVTLAGIFYQYSPGYADGPGNLARFYNAMGGCFSQGTVFIADSGNNRIRSITFNPQPQVVAPASLQLNTYPGLRITGTVGRTYEIQTAPNLSAWTPKATLLLTVSPYLWIDDNAVSGNKYYRAVMLP